MSKLHLINNTSSNSSDYLHIIDNSEQSLIANGDILVTERTKSSDRPMHCSELAKRLSNRSYNKASGIFVNTWKEEDEFDDSTVTLDLIKQVDGRNYLEYPARAIIDTREKSEDESENEYYRIDSDFNNGDFKFKIEDIENFYNKLFGTMAEKEICFYNSSKKIINILDDTVTLDLITPFSDTYTDNISIKNILKLPYYETMSGKLDVTIQYSKEDIETGNINIFSRDVSIEGFRYESGELILENLVEDINSDVRLEYIQGDLKVSPLKNNIIECIINKCELTYGNI